MKPKSSKSCTARADEGYLPGFGDDECKPPAASGDRADSDALFEKSRGYWIKKSAEQRLDGFGRPAGFHYQLMLGSKILESGTGLNCRLRFLSQVTFLNAQQSRTNP